MRTPNVLLVMTDQQPLTKGAWFRESCVPAPLIMRIPGRLAGGEAVAPKVG